MASNTDCNSSGERQENDVPDNPRLDAAALAESEYLDAKGELALTSNAARDNPGIISLHSSMRLPMMSLAELENPVTFASGRARLFTRLLPSGSDTNAKMTGIFVVASLA